MKTLFILLTFVSGLASAADSMTCTASRTEQSGGAAVVKTVDISGWLTLDGDDMGPGDYDYIADITLNEGGVSSSYTLVGEEKTYSAGSLYKDETKILSLRSEIPGTRKMSMSLMNRAQGTFLLDQKIYTLNCVIK
jgi:hypothetical protein